MASQKTNNINDWQITASGRDLADFLPDAVFETDAQLRLTYLNRAGMELLRIQPGTLKQPLNLRDIIVFSARQAEQHIAAALGGETPSVHEYLAKRQDEGRFIASIRLACCREKDKSPGLCGVIFNINTFKQTEQDLIERMDTFRTLFTCVFDAFAVFEIISDAAGGPVDCRFLDVNPAYEQLLDRPASDIVGHTLKELLPGTEPEWIKTLGEVAIKGNTIRFEGLFGELGRHLQVSAFSPKRGQVAALFLDVTEQKYAEERDREMAETRSRAEHWQWVASLAGGFAHTLNNCIAPIVCYPDLILTQVGEDPPFKQDLMTIKTSAQRALAVIEDLVILGRGGAIRLEPVDLNTIVQDYLDGIDFLNIRGYFPKIEFSTELAGHLPAMQGAPTQLARAIMHMIQHSFEAMNGHGCLRVATGFRKLPEPIRVCSGRLSAGEYVTLTVTDTGRHFDADEMEKIFEPFQKLRRMERRGSDLTLALVHHVVKSHQGGILVRSAPNTETEFTLFFSLSRADALEPMPEPDIPGAGTILIVDDMPTQRDLAAKALSSLGYSVITAQNGREAVRLVEKALAPNQGPLPDLILIDMIMEEDFDGLDTFQRIRHLVPKQKCALVSGFAKSDRVREAETLGALYFIRKPYTVEKLGRAVRNALASIV